MIIISNSFCQKKFMRFKCFRTIVSKLLFFMNWMLKKKHESKTHDNTTPLLMFLPNPQRTLTHLLSLVCKGVNIRCYLNTMIWYSCFSHIWQILFINFTGGLVPFLVFFFFFSFNKFSNIYSLKNKRQYNFTQVCFNFSQSFVHKQTKGGKVQ